MAKARVGSSTGAGGMPGTGVIVSADGWSGGGGSSDGSISGKLPGTKKVSRNVRDLIGGLTANDLTSGHETSQYQALIDSIIRGSGQMGDLATGDLADKGMRGARTGANYAAGTAKDAYGFSQSMLPYATDIMNMGMDPQNALYDRTVHDLTQQQRAGQAARGIEMSPYAAGMEADTLKDFNIDWRNTQLDRATRAGEAATAMGRGAFDIGSDASKLAASGALLPYSTKLGFLNDAQTARNNAAGAYEREADFGLRSNQVAQQAISDMLQYLGMGPGYQSAATGQQHEDNALMNGLITSIVPGLFGK